LGGGKTGAVGVAPKTPALDWLPEQEANGRAVDGTVRLSLDVQGIRCAACVWLLQEVWKRQPGAKALRVDASLGRAQLVYDGAQQTAAKFLARTAQLGYPMAVASRTPRRETGLLVRLGVCAAIAMNAMILAFAQYFGLTAAGGSLDALFGWVSLGLASASVAIGGPVFFRAAWAGLRSGTVHMDLPISLGLLLAYAGSVHGLLSGGAVYFDTVAIFIAFMVGGRFVQERTLARSRDLVLADDGVEHLRSRRIVDGRIEVAPVRALAAGDQLLLAPGDLVPVRVRLGAAASISLDWIDGESEPRAFAVGDDIRAGAFVAGRRAVPATVVADYANSGLAELLQQTRIERDDGRGRVRFWERLARSYSMAVLLFAALGAALWYFLDASRSIPVAVAVLVITCPCAMGIATPLSFHLALAGLRRRGVFVRTQSLLDKLPLVRKVVFDKTGTVTFGGLRAEAVVEPRPEVLAVLATMAASSNHPASQAVLAALPSDAGFVPDLTVEEQPGGGLIAQFDGCEYRLGSAHFGGVEADPANPRECVFAQNGTALARFRLEEDFRDGAAGEVAALRARGLEVHMLSGDRPDRVAAAAALLGVDPKLAIGGMSPEGKADYVRRIDQRDTLMVGDGINDAPAFAASFCAGTPAMDRPVLPARSDFFFRGAQAGAVVAALDAAQRRSRVVRANLALAVAYNSSTIVLCFCGLMTPLLCAVLMPLSSIALVLHTTVRLGRSS
jgi:Cu2+-exporting ATPase